MTPDVPGWVRDAVFYQIFPDRFASSELVTKPGLMEAWDAPPTAHGFKGGDLLGVMEHLPYLDDLGVTALYLTPIFSSASNHRYHTYDYFTVDPLLGGNDALRSLLDAAHDRGMRVVLDGVFNHSGRGFWPFHHVLETGLASPYRGWFHIDEAVLASQGRLNAYPEPGDLRPHGYDAWWNLPGLPKLNTDEPQVREYIFSVAEHWLRFGIDGWRLDVPTEIDDEGFWQEFRRRCRAVDPEAYLVGEIWHLAPEWLRGDRFDAVMNYPLAEAILGFAGGSALAHDVIREHGMYRNDLRPLTGSAFGERVMELSTAYDPSIVAVQLDLLGSHDTPRMRTVVGGDLARVRMATLLQVALPGAPCIYYGDEIGLSGGNDPACRAGFPWAEARWETSLRDSVKALLSLRHAEPGLRDGRLSILGASETAVAIERGEGSSRFVVAANAGTEPARLDLWIADAATGAGGHLAPVGLSGFGGVAECPIVDSRASMDLAPLAAAILRIV